MGYSLCSYSFHRTTKAENLDIFSYIANCMPNMLALPTSKPFPLTPMVTNQRGISHVSSAFYRPLAIPVLGVLKARPMLAGKPMLPCAPWRY